MCITKVLIIHPSFWINGGAEKVIIKLANYLTAHNIPNTILTTDMIPEIRVQLTETRLLLCNSIQEMHYVAQNIANDFDIVNLHNHPAELLMFGKRIPTVWQCNEPHSGGVDEEGKYNVPQHEINMVRKSINKIIVADEFNKKRIKEIYGHDLDIEIIEYGVDYNFFKSGNAGWIKEKYDLHDKFVITQIGFIADTKNQLKTIDIFKEVKEKNKHAILVLAGKETGYTKVVKEKIKKYNLEKEVIFTGFLCQEDIRDLYHASNIVLFPVKSQGSWLSVLEAMCAKIPVIVSKEMTGSELLKRNNVGIVADTIQDYINAIFYKEYDFRNAQKFAKLFTWDKYCQKMVDAFEQCISRK